MKILYSLWIKNFFTVALLITIIMASVSYVLTYRQIDDQRRELANNIGRIAKQIASIRLAETGGWYVYQEWIDNIVGSDIGQDIVYIAIFDEADTLRASALNSNWLELGDRSLSHQEQAKVIRSLSRRQIAKESMKDFDHLLIDIHWGQESLGKVDVGFSLVEFNNKVRQKLFINLQLLCVFLVLGFAGSILISRRMIRPLNTVSDAMISVSKGDLNHSLTVKRKDEIGQLSRSFNYMTARLREKVVIEHFTHDLHFTLDVQKLVQVITDQIGAALDAQMVVLFQVEKYGNEAIALFASSTPHGQFNETALRIPEKVFTTFLNQTEPLSRQTLLLSKDLELFFIKIQDRWTLTIDRACPLVNQNSLIGLLVIGQKSLGIPYTTEEYQLLANLTVQATMALENALLLRELTEKERLEKELEIARSVQKRFLPQADPDIPGAFVTGVCLPATEVGGDYFDYFQIGKHKTGIVIADVTGKGTSAAFYMAEVKGMMTSLSQIITSPKELLLKVNKQLFDSLDKRLFVTMIYAVLDFRKRTCTFVRAGHTPLLRKRARKSQVEVLVPPGMGLGLADTPIFKKHVMEQELSLSKGDLILLYTDGVSEAMNSENEEFGEERLVRSLENTNALDNTSLRDEILQELRIFQKQTPQHDDITMIMIKIS
jgi:serine phosphatase RsbU (regulator of sigma subunit)/HAMP domain-containing protein